MSVAIQLAMIDLCIDGADPINCALRFPPSGGKQARFNKLILNDEEKYVRS